MFLDVWRSYMYLNENVKCFFITNTNESLEWDVRTCHGNVKRDGDFLFVEGVESFENMFSKTLACIEFILMQYPNVTHILRTNISAVWSWERLLHTISLIPNGVDASGLLLNFFGCVPFLSGQAYILTKSIAERLIKEPNDHIHNNEFDDVRLGHVFRRMGVTPHDIPDFRLDLCDINRQIETDDPVLQSKFVFIRCKHNDLNKRLTFELENMKTFVQVLYRISNKNN